MSISLTQPSVGSTSWGGDVNQNFQTIQDALNGVQAFGPVNVLNGSGSYLRVPQLTTAERDALTAVNGMIIYNTTTAQFERYQAGAWGAFTAGSAYATVQEEGSDLTQRTKLNFIGNAVTAADDSGNARTNVTLSQSPSGSTSVVGTGRAINTSEGVQGGGDLSADRTLKLDINGLTEDTTPDGSNDFVATYDASAATHKKVKPVNMPAFTGDSGSGGVRGQVPAPAAGDAAAGKFLKADGAFVQVSDAALSTSDVTTNNVSSTKHGFAPKSPSDATQFLNGAATPAFAQVKDSDLSTSDITTNDVSTSKHGFAPKAPNDATKFLDGTGAWSVPSSGSTEAAANKVLRAERFY